MSFDYRRESRLQGFHGGMDHVLFKYMQNLVSWRLLLHPGFELLNTCYLALMRLGSSQKECLMSTEAAAVT